MEWPEMEEDRGDEPPQLAFADLGQTLAEIFGVGPLPNGRSFLREMT